MNPAFKKTALASVMAAAVMGAGIPAAEANVINVSWSGAFTMLNPAGSALTNSPSDYQGLTGTVYANGYYANGAASFGTPAYPGNAVNGTANTYYAGAVNTTHGWKGKRTPVSGTMSFDTSTGAGVGTVNDFFFFGDTPGSGAGTSVARALGISFASIDTVGTLVGTMLFSWNGGGHSVSIVLDASGMFAAIAGGAFSGGPTSTISGVGALPATDGYNWGTSKNPELHALGPSPVATKTLNTGAGCDGTPIATQVNAYTINPIASTVGTCTTGMVDDGIGGDPMTSSAFGSHNANFDITSVHFDSFVTPSAVPVPAAVWLFGSGLLGLVGIARRKKKA